MFLISYFIAQLDLGQEGEQEKKITKNPTREVLTRWHFSLLNLLSVKYHYFVLKNEWEKLEAHFNESHKRFSKCFQIGSTGTFLRLFF